MGATISNPFCHQKPSGGLYLAPDQLNIPNAAWTLVNLDTIIDLRQWSDGIENTGTHRITPGIPGLYLVIGQVQWKDPIATKLWKAAIYRDGGMFKQATLHSSTTDVLTINLSAIIPMTAIEYVDLYVYQSSGLATADIDGGQDKTFLYVQRVR